MPSTNQTQAGMPGEWLPAAQVGIAGLSSIINPILQHNENIRNRRFAREQYDRQRSDYLADRDFENKYNSPEQQMQRLKEAGLNPNLVYGHGSATVNSASTKSASAATPTGQAPTVDGLRVAQTLGEFQDYAIKKLQADVLKSNLENTEKIIRLNDEKYRNLRMQTETGELKFSWLNDTYWDRKELLSEQLRGKKLSNEGQNLTNEKMRILMQPTLAKMLAEIKTIELEQENIPWKRRMIQAQISNLAALEAYTKSKHLTEDKQRMILDTVHESKLMDVLIKGEQMTLLEQQDQLNEIRIKFRSMGLSETVTSDLINALANSMRSTRSFRNQ